MFKAVQQPVFRPVLQSVMLAGRGSTLPEPIQSYVFGVNETQTPSIGIALAETYLAGTGLIQTVAAHGMWTSGTPEEFTVAGTGTVLDLEPSPFVDSQVGNDESNIAYSETPVDESSVTGTLTYVYPRLSGWNGATQATVAKMPRKATDAYQFDGIDDELVCNFSIIPAATGWACLFIYRVRAVQTGYRVVSGKSGVFAFSTLGSDTVGQRDFFQFSNDAGTGTVGNVTTGWASITPSTAWSVLLLWGDNTVRNITSNGGSRYYTAAASIGALVPGDLGNALGGSFNAAIDIGRVKTFRKLNSTAEANAIVAAELAAVGGTNNWTPIP